MFGTSRKRDLKTKTELNDLNGRTNIKVISRQKYIDEIGIECAREPDNALKQYVLRHNTTNVTIPDRINTTERTVNTSYCCFGERGRDIDPVSYDMIEAMYKLDEIIHKRYEIMKYSKRIRESLIESDRSGSVVNSERLWDVFLRSSTFRKKCFRKISIENEHDYLDNTRRSILEIIEPKSTTSISGASEDSILMTESIFSSKETRRRFIFESTEE